MKNNTWQIAFYALIILIAVVFVNHKYSLNIDLAFQRGQVACREAQIDKARKRAIYQEIDYKSQLLEDMRKSTGKLVLDRTIRWFNSF